MNNTFLVQQIDILNKLSQQNAIDPNIYLDFSECPSPHQFWMSEHLLSLYGTPEYQQLTLEQRRQLSQLEFSLLCSLSCAGEIEVVSAVAQLMLKPRYESVRKYLYFFIKEENNHIFMFSEFCRRYGKLYPVYYPHLIKLDWDEPLINDLLIFLHVLIFEELINDINRVLAKDESLPPLVRSINHLHSLDEGRHIVFGRQLLKSLTEEVLATISDESLIKLHEHIIQYLNVRHHEYHNAEIYRAMGIPNAVSLHQGLIAKGGIHYFARDRDVEKKLIGVLKFLKQIGLLTDEGIKRCNQGLIHEKNTIIF
jgi:hypothetical protein